LFEIVIFATFLDRNKRYITIRN